MAEDISKKTVAVLLVVAIVISIVGTWVVLNAGPSLGIFGKEKSNSGQIFVGISGKAAPSVQTGTVAIGIDKSK